MFSIKHHLKDKHLYQLVNNNLSYNYLFSKTSNVTLPDEISLNTSRLSPSIRANSIIPVGMISLS